MRKATPQKSSGKYIKWIVFGAIGLVVLVYGGIFVYTNFINDAPDKLDESDLSAALAATTIPGSTDDADADVDADGFNGDWAPTSGSEFGYRVNEVLAGVNSTAVGRSNEVDGLLVIDGTSATTVDIEVQVADITSDDSRRDGRFRGAIMNSSEFPTASFALTAPIEFGEIPDDGGQVAATATGELTLRGVTNPVTFEVTAEATPGRIGVLGSIPVAFSDYGIDNPSFGAVKTEDDGLVEFVLVFERPA